MEEEDGMTVIRGAKALIVIVLVALVGMQVSLVHGSSSHAVVGAPQRGGNLVFAHGIDIKTLDPIKAVETETIYPLDMMYETLFVAAPNGQHLTPWLAAGYRLSKDKKTWTFTLRSGLKFSNGKPVTAADVKFSIDRNTKSGGFNFINSAIKRVSAPKANTVVIQTKYPWSPLLADLSLWANAVIPKNFGGESYAAFFKKPVGTGPFVLDHWSKGSELKLVRNSHYWQSGKPYLDSVTWTVVPDDNTRILQLKGGQIGIDAAPPYSTLSSLKSSPGVDVQVFPSTLETYVLLNEKAKPFQDVHVRRAIAYAIDRKALVRAVLFGNGAPACSFMAPTLPYNAQNFPCIAYSLQKAKREMAQSSVPKGFKTTLLVGGTDVYNESIAEIVQQQLAPLGIKVTLRKIDPGQVYTTESKFDYQMGMEGWSSDIADPDEQVSFMCDPVGGGANSYNTLYTNKNVIRWTRAAAREFNDAKRAQLYRKIQVQVNADSPWTSLVFAKNAFATSSKVHGFFVYPTGNYHLQDVWLSK
jgi:peptide/nickel transport system substrate-binding protein